MPNSQKKPTEVKHRNASTSHFSLSLNQESEFFVLYKKTKPMFGKYFSIRFLERKQDVTVRFGVVIGNKIEKSAVVRNKKKRQMREIIRSYRPRLTKSGWCMIVMTPEVLKATHAEMKKEFERLALKSGILD